MTDPGRRWSLRRRLVTVTLGAATLVWLLSAAALYVLTLRTAGRAYDEAMTEAAQLILLLADHEYAETRGTYRPVVPAANLVAQPYMRYQVWTAARRLLLRSESAPEHALASDFGNGLSDQVVDGERWRVYALNNALGSLQIQIGEPYAHRRESGNGMVIAVLGIALLCTATLFAAIWWTVDRVITQMGDSAREVGNRSARDLSPLAPTLLPEEFRPLADAINALLRRLHVALEAEKRLTADASHELRTPLAAIKVQAQVARRAGSREAADHALARLDAGVDRAARLVDQLLSAARIDPLMAHPPANQRPVEIRDEVDELVESYRELIDSKQLRLSRDIADAPWHGDATPLRILLRNLLDNALRYTPAGGQVRIRHAIELGTRILQVSDDGPGIPSAEGSRVFDPFYRVPGSTDTGSGLGLAIVRQIVQALGGSVELGPGIDGKGVTVSARLPLEPQATAAG